MPSEREMALPKRRIIMSQPDRCVQSYISCVAAPETIDQLLYYVNKNVIFDIEHILSDNPHLEWSAPKWAQLGDLVFFYHTKSALQKINKLKKDVLEHKSFLGEKYSECINAIGILEEIYEACGASIFAIGQITGRPFSDDVDSDKYHWKSRVYASIDLVEVLKNPIDLDEFKGFIKMNTQSSIIPVLGKDFDDLKRIIVRDNKDISLIDNCKARPLPLKNINSDNWLSVSGEYRRHFFLEEQFREYYVDYLLTELSDNGKFYSECKCYKEGNASGFADNCIIVQGKHVFLEVKLSVSAESNLQNQLLKYSDVDKFMAKGKYIHAKDIIQNKVLVIDLDAIGIFYADSGELVAIEMLDNIKSKGGIQKIKKRIIELVE